MVPHEVATIIKANRLFGYSITNEGNAATAV
jgi:hypothetical protein